ncbi:MAG: uroporphyrinogen-III C-methyltransferase [Lachnospiraceae bacterium]|nr:uroporphyrinogen-III C-methyltransferase [Lachnospiraceae bacterium]
MYGKVWIVGAGPSDVSLLTKKALRVLGQAEVVVYDQLVDLSILLQIPENAILYDAGKHAGNHTLTQEEINALLVKEAKEGKRVVRLKGGDPFVFGRGGEEVEALNQEGIGYEIIPGITSAIAVPAYAGIPVTHRDFTPSFHVVTAHRKRGNEEGVDFASLASLGEVTLVFLMGVGALKKICEGLIAAGVRKDRAAAVIQNGARYNQKKVIGTLEDLPKKAEEANIGTPGIIVVGDVCTLEKEFAWAEGRALGTKRVIVTRPKEKEERLSELLRDEGAEVLELPVTSIVMLKDQKRMQRLKEEAASYDWIVFTSEMGADCFFEQLIEHEIDIRAFAKAKMAVIGERTRTALKRRGIFADFEPKKHYGDELAKELEERLNKEERILVIVPENKESRCLTALQNGAVRTGCRIEALPLYRTEYKKPRFFQWKEEDIVTFASSSAVEGFVQNIDEEDCKKVRAVCIGTHTLATAKQYGMQAVMADDTTMESIVKKVMEL